MSNLIKAFYATSFSDVVYNESYYETIDQMCDRAETVENELKRMGRNYRDLIHKYRKCHIYGLTDDRVFSIYEAKSNKMHRNPILMQQYEFGPDDKCFYFCRYNHKDYINISERALFEQLIEEYPNSSDDFYFNKIFLDYLYDMTYRFDDDCASINRDEKAKTASINTNDPEEMYWEYAKRFIYEGYYVDRSGTRYESIMVCNDVFNKGYHDFTIPERVEEMKMFKYPIVWYPVDEDGFETWADNYGQIL